MWRSIRFNHFIFSVKKLICSLCFFVWWNKTGPNHYSDLNRIRIFWKSVFFLKSIINWQMYNICYDMAIWGNIFALKGKKGTTLRIYKLNNNNKAIKSFKSTGMGKKKKSKQIFRSALKLDGEQMLQKDKGGLLSGSTSFRQPLVGQKGLWC